jgi:HSP90 family molecular chaperone
MTKDELVQNLGKIGFSGTGEFAKILEDADQKKNLIGHFGVGFYSAFMVGTKVKVYSKGCKEEGDMGYIWESDGYVPLYNYFILYYLIVLTI